MRGRDDFERCRPCPPRCDRDRFEPCRERRCDPCQQKPWGPCGEKPWTPCGEKQWSPSGDRGWPPADDGRWEPDREEGRWEMVPDEPERGGGCKGRGGAKKCPTLREFLIKYVGKTIRVFPQNGVGLIAPEDTVGALDWVSVDALVLMPGDSTRKVFFSLEDIVGFEPVLTV